MPDAGCIKWNKLVLPNDSPVNNALDIEEMIDCICTILRRRPALDVRLSSAALVQRCALFVLVRWVCHAVPVLRLCLRALPSVNFNLVTSPR